MRGLRGLPAAYDMFVSYSSGIPVCLPTVWVGGYIGKGSDETYPLGIGMADTPAANRMTVESLMSTLDAALERTDFGGP